MSKQIGDLVDQRSVLVVGATGSLGRQIVRRALDEGYGVKCIVRPREIPADFLREWGATVINADLTDPASIPATMVGVHTVIDAATARPEESIKLIDWSGKVALVQTSQAMSIQRFIFFSIFNCEKYPSVPLMSVKTRTEEFLRDTGLNYTIFRLCGFMQAIIGNCAIPILEERSVWGTSDDARTPYIDTSDVAQLTLASLTKPELIGRTLTLAGPKGWTTTEVIELCETLSGAKTAKVTQVPVWLLKATRVLLSGFQWTKNASDRLAFTDIVREDDKEGVITPRDYLEVETPERGIYSDKNVQETYELLGPAMAELNNKNGMLTLEEYLGDYYGKIVKKLKEVGAESRQTDFYV